MEPICPPERISRYLVVNADPRGVGNISTRQRLAIRGEKGDWEDCRYRHSLPHRAMINLSDSGQTGIGFGWKPVAAVAAGVLVALVAGYEAGQGNFAIAASLAAVIGIIAALSRPHLIVAVGGFLLLVPIATVLSIPGNEIGAALIVAGAWAAKREQTTLPTAVLVIVPIFIGWLLIIQLIHPNGADGWHRMLHLLLLLALATTGASGRIPTRSLAIGIGTAMALSTVLVVASVGPYQSAYEGRASGFFGDPNTFAVTAAVLTPFMFGFLRSAWIRWSLLICAIVVISASLSRTGILSLYVGLAVMLYMPRIRGWTLVFPTVAATFLWLLPLLPDWASYRLFGPFSDREGSDDLRFRIQDASEKLTAQSPVTGNGLGSAKVELHEGNFFFHNSYYGIVSEVGLIGVAIYAVLVISALVSGIRNNAVAAVAAISAALVGAASLGEVLLDLPLGLAIGLAWVKTAYGEGQSKSDDGANQGRTVVEPAESAH